MKKLTPIFTFLLVLISSLSYGQEKPASSKIILTGNIIESNSKKPLEYATITLKNTSNPKLIFGGITDNKGNFLS